MNYGVPSILANVWIRLLFFKPASAAARPAAAPSVDAMQLKQLKEEVDDVSTVHIHLVFKLNS